MPARTITRSHRHVGSFGPATSVAPKRRKDDELSEIENEDEYADGMDEDMEQANLQQILQMYKAQTNKTSANGKAFQVKGRLLLENARSRVDALRAEFHTSIEETRDEMNRAHVAEADLNLSNLARLFGHRNQKHIHPILDIYDSAFAEISKNRVLLVQEVGDDVKRMSMVRSRAWKRSVSQAQETIAGQAAELKEATDTSEYINSFMQLLKV